MIISVTDDASYGILERGKELREIKTSSLISTVRKQKCLTLVQTGTCILHGLLLLFLHGIINYFCKILSQYTIYIHQTPVFIHVPYSLFPTPGTRKTSTHFSTHNVCHQMQYLDYVRFNIHVLTDFCLCGREWSIMDIQKILLFMKWQQTNLSRYVIHHMCVCVCVCVCECECVWVSEWVSEGE